jgi:aconitate hydratase
MDRISASKNTFGSYGTFTAAGKKFHYYRLEVIEKQGSGDISILPISLKILLEAVLRQEDGVMITRDDIQNLAGWGPNNNRRKEIPFKPSRIIMQDFTGVPAVVDLAVMRDALITLKGDPHKINPIIPVDLVIDHSVQVDQFGTKRALEFNSQREFERNRERYEFLHWGAQAFSNFRVVPPATGIVHQVNLEYLATVVHALTFDGNILTFPDTLVGTDSHTTMINGLGVLGWGVGGIEAEAAMLGQPISIITPDVIGFRFRGELKEGVTATDLVLTVTEKLRKYGVVGKFVEFFGPGLRGLSLPDRATIANMSPEFGATMAFFPVDRETLAYLRITGRSPESVALIESYTKEQGMFRTDDMPQPTYTDVLELDMSTVEPSVAGPRRPQDRTSVKKLKTIQLQLNENKPGAIEAEADVDGSKIRICDGSVVIAAITSCTNTSNPSVMVFAGLVAKKALEAGLSVPPYVKTSLAPGSKVVTQYLESAGLLRYLEALGFHIVGYGCTTCIGNSGPLHPSISKAIADNNLTVASVLSGNRNFEGRIHSEVKANFLASPPLVVAYALAGTVLIDLTKEPLGQGPDGSAVFLRDIWPESSEIQELIERNVSAEIFSMVYQNVFTGNETWNQISAVESNIYPWNETSTYIRKPPFFDGLSLALHSVKPIRGARALAVLGDTVTTDHISPAGAIPAESPAGKWLIAHGVTPDNFNTYGSRRGNHEVMVRGTFGNIRIRNKLVPSVEGGYTLFHPEEEVLPIYDAAVKYLKHGTPLVVIAGKDYGAGSSRDWAAKGTALLGVRTVIAESFERIHRSNLIGMGVLPLQFLSGESFSGLKLRGNETFDFQELKGPGQMLKVTAQDEKGHEKNFTVIARIDSNVELQYFQNGGILQTVLREFASINA